VPGVAPGLRRDRDGTARSRLVSLRGVLIGVVLLLLVPALALGVIASLSLNRSLRAEAEARLAAGASALAGATAQTIAGHSALLSVLVAPQDFDPSPGDPVLEAQLLAAARKLGGTVVLTDAEGRAGATANAGPMVGTEVLTRLALGTMAADAPVVSDLLPAEPQGNSQPESLREGLQESQGESLRQSPASGPAYAIGIAVPVPPTATATRRGAAVLLLDPTSLLVRLEATAATTSGTMFGSIADSRGRVLLRGIQQDQMLGREIPDWIRTAIHQSARGQLAGRSIGDAEVLLAYERVPGTGWTAAMLQDEAAIASASRSTMLGLLGAGLLLAGLATTGAVLATRRVLDSVRNLVAAAEGRELSGPIRIAELETLRRELAARAERLLLAIEGTGLATWDVDIESGVAHWSPNHFAMFGLPPEPEGLALGDTYRRRVHPDDMPVVEEAHARARAGTGWLHMTHRIIRADDGAVRWIEVFGRYLLRDGRPRVAGIIQDVTERRDAERRLRAAQGELLQVSRLSVTAAVAAGLAHELNQPLTAATNFLTAAGRLLGGTEAGAPPPAPKRLAAAREALAEAGDQAQRAAQIVRRLRAFIGRDKGETKPEDLRSLVEEAVTLAVAGGVDAPPIQTYVAPGTPRVLADRVQIQQVIVNLVRNALDALRNAPERRIRVEVRPAAARGQVEVAVADSGPGFDATIRDRLFHPFASTKPEGLGVGLSICRSIVEVHGGRIFAENGPEGGAVVRFTLRAAGEWDDAAA
jgi:two-component system sensor kinase FixL